MTLVTDISIWYDPQYLEIHESNQKSSKYVTIFVLKDLKVKKIKIFGLEAAQFMWYNIFNKRNFFYLRISYCCPLVNAFHFIPFCKSVPASKQLPDSMQAMCITR